MWTWVRYKELHLSHMQNTPPAPQSSFFSCGSLHCLSLVVLFVFDASGPISRNDHYVLNQVRLHLIDVVGCLLWVFDGLIVLLSLLPLFFFSFDILSTRLVACCGLLQIASVVRETKSMIGGSDVRKQNLPSTPTTHHP